MPTQKLLNLIDTYKGAICLSAARKVATLQLRGYTNQNETQIAAHLVDPLTFVSHYIQTGQVEEWQAYIGRGTRFWLSQGWPSVEMSQTARCIIEAIGEMAKRKLPGKSHEQERLGYQQRLNSVLMLTSSIIVATKLQSALKEPG